MLKLNSDQREKSIQTEIDLCYKLIESNLNKGQKDTELYVPKDLGSEIRAGLEKKFLAEKAPLIFMIVDRRLNPHTGNMDSFTGMTIGNERYYKVRWQN